MLIKDIKPGFMMCFKHHTSMVLSVQYIKLSTRIHIRWIWEDLKITETTYQMNYRFIMSDNFTYIV